MPSKFNMKSFLFALIVIDVSIMRNFVRAEEWFPGVDVESFDDFSVKVLNSEQPVITQYHAPWCAPCKTLTRTLEKAIKEQEGKVRWARVDVAPDALESIARQQGIRSVPIVNAYKGGRVVDQLIGLATEKQIRAFIKKQID